MMITSYLNISKRNISKNKFLVEAALNRSLKLCIDNESVPIDLEATQMSSFLLEITLLYREIGDTLVGDFYVLYPYG